MRSADVLAHRRALLDLADAAIHAADTAVQVAYAEGLRLAAITVGQASDHTDAVHRLEEMLTVAHSSGLRVGISKALELTRGAP